MPQMSPLWWELIFCLNLICFTMMFIKLFFTNQIKFLNKSKKQVKKNMLLLW